MPMQLFIDTNILLNFYHQSGDEPEVLDRLVKLLETGDVVLNLPEQIEDEFVRNRETKLRGTHNDFDKGAFQDRVPRHMASLQLASRYEEAVRNAVTARNQLLIEARGKAVSKSFDVDAKLEILFASAQRWGHDDAVYLKARTRKERGNPPGKTNSYGDQYNWEMLLAKVPADDLYVVSRDNDYASVVGKKDKSGMTAPNPFLAREWKRHKNDKQVFVFDSIKNVLTYYTGVLSQLAAPENGEPAGGEENAAELAEDGIEQNLDANGEHGAGANGAVQPEVENAPAEVPQGENVPQLEPVETEEELASALAAAQGVLADAALTDEQRAAKNQAVVNLINSPNFAMTHIGVAELRPLEEFLTSHDANMLAHGAIDNRQIRWIISDDDVKAFFLRLLNKHIAHLDPIALEGLGELLDLTGDSTEESEVSSTGEDI